MDKKTGYTLRRTKPPAKRHRGIQGFLRQAFAGVEVRGPVASFVRSGGSPGDHWVPAMDVATKRCSDLKD